MTAATATDRAARIVTEVSTPAVSVFAVAILCGIQSTGGWDGAAWGAVLGIFCAVIPYVTLEIAARRGRITDRHVTKRGQRPWAYAMCLASVAAGIVTMLVLGAPILIQWALGTMVAALVISAAVTALGPKVSMHAMCLTAFFVLAALFTTLWWLAGLAILLPVVVWSRLRLEHHSPVEAVLGTIIGAAVTVVSWFFAPV
ncbi:hypothetical protein [Microbacterium sp.]|uniref:hypothetical protein n=1 Tax=Microbacterium sp. TaxID=51671 RepID=UPI002603666E|nr:hypothetical protein [Microbacterium sp.]